MIPLTDNFSTKVEQKTNENSSVPLIAYSAYQTSTKSELAKYHHQSLWLLPVTTLIKAIKNNQLSSLPGLTQKLMASLPPSTATIKGHMHRTRQGLISTRIKHNEPDLGYKSDNMNPPQEAHSGIERKKFRFAALADTNEGTIYKDLPVRLPVRSVRNMQYIFVHYAYKPNDILVRPMKERGDDIFL